eukprot:6844110-Prymnesium_polylepis.1
MPDLDQAEVLHCMRQGRRRRPRVSMSGGERIQGGIEGTAARAPLRPRACIPSPSTCPRGSIRRYPP